MLNIFNIQIKNRAENEEINILVGGKEIAMERFMRMTSAFAEMNCEITVISMETGELIAVFDGIKTKIF